MDCKGLEWKWENKLGWNEVCHLDYNKLQNGFSKPNLMILRGASIINCLTFSKDKNSVYIMYQKGD